MSLAAHLRELRRRIIIIAIVILLGAVAGWFIAEPILQLLRTPISQIAIERNATLNYPTLTSSFDLRMQLAIYSGILLTSPVWLYQIWAFLVPGLTKREKRYSVSFILAAVPLFLGGAFVGWLVFPNIVKLLLSFAPPEDSTIINAREYIDFAIRMLLAVGTAFVVPVFLVMLNFLGVLSAKAMLKSWRVAVLVIVLFAGITTPAADILSMLIIAGVMTLLYFLALLIAWLHDRRAEKRNQEFLGEALG